MRLLVPASSLIDAQELIKCGADDIYLGASSDIFNNYSFNGRSRISKQGKCVLPPFHEIKKICSYVHTRGGQVYFLANIPIVNENSNLFYEKFLEYIESGINAGVDYIILGNITAIKWIRKKYPDVKIVVSSYLEVQNEMSLKMFEEMGASQIVLSYQCDLDDIKALTQKSKIKIEVFGHGGCSFYVGSCNLFHEMGEISEIGYPCRALYKVLDEYESSREVRALDCFKMCSLCRLKQLDECGVHSLKIVGRDLPSNYILEIVKVYYQALQLVKSNQDISINMLPKWWKKSWCQSGRLCRYGGDFNGCN